MARTLQFAVPPSSSDDPDRGPLPAGEDTPRRGGTGEASTHQQPVGDEEYEFRLFSTTAPSKVVLVPEAAPDGEAEWKQYRAAALTGEDVLALSKQRCWGLEVPWRVTTIEASRKELGALEASTAGDTADTVSDEGEDTAGALQKKKRPGKKRRIALRIKEKADKAKAEAELKLQMSKEEHLAEKKKRLNREKKLKRREKERAKKAAGKAGDGEDGSEGTSD